MVVRLLWAPFQVFSAINSYEETQAILYLIEISTYIGICIFLVNSRLEKKAGHWSLIVSMLLNNSIIALFMFYDFINILNFSLLPFLIDWLPLFILGNGVPPLVYGVLVYVKKRKNVLLKSSEVP